MLEIGSMPKKTITKNLPVVIFCAFLSVLVAGCGHSVINGGRPPIIDDNGAAFGAPSIAGRIESAEIDESSGLAASKCQDGLLWTHNDSDDGPFLYAIDTAGRRLGTWKVAGADNRDWEDIALYKDTSGKCFLLIGEIGNSSERMRSELKIYRTEEPAVDSGSRRTSRKESATTLPADVLAFSYPDTPHDAETLMVHPVTADIYVVTKQRETAAGIYRLKPRFGEVITAERVAELKVPAIPNGFLTGGDISPDGKSVAICDYFAGYEFTLPSPGAAFDEVWTQKPHVFSLGDRKQGEAITYSADGQSVFATSEGKHQPLFTVKRQQP